MSKKRKKINYNKWGYYFVAPFVLVYVIFSLIPLLSTFYYSFFEYYYAQGGFVQVGPNFIGFGNYVKLFSQGLFMKYLGNTIILWLISFIPQIIISLLMALWFTSFRLKLKGTTFFKTIMYMPNLVMAAAFSMLFVQLFSNTGGLTTLLMDMGIIPETFSFVDKVWPTRFLIAAMNFLMWFGNTTILLMAGIMGIDDTLIESASVDGANSRQTFTKITLPLLKPILLFVLVTSLVGGVQLYDIPYVFTKGTGGPNGSSQTVMMYISGLLKTSKQYDMAGTASVILFLFTTVISIFFFLVMNRDEIDDYKEERRIKKEMKK
ncbi:MAG: sugar ABC transporter permease [Acholeplasmataceae bacterium]|nr:sugar ABC transporter permease [Acholeplasmataceae bacterium]MDD4824373.1 sugar ABC transporter permease [Acholeplasmataceae bacterium]